MSETKSSKGNARRKLLKGIAAGSGAVIAGQTLPENWSRPVVDSVMLPAHAQTSINAYTASGPITSGAVAPDSIYARGLDMLVQPATAAPDYIIVESICVGNNGDGTVKVDALISDDLDVAVFSAAAVPVAGAPVALVKQGECVLVVQNLLDGFVSKAHAGGPINSDDLEVQIDSVGDRALGTIFSRGDTTTDLDLPAGNCTPPSCDDFVDM